MNLEYIGIYHDCNLPMEGKLLVSYINETEIIIRYDEEHPFRITQISILLENSEQMTLYDTFKCDYLAATDVDAKAFATSFAELILKYRKEYGSYLDGLKHRAPLK